MVSAKKSHIYNAATNQKNILKIFTWVFPKIGVGPQIINFNRVSIIFTIHFGCFPQIFGSTPMWKIKQTKRKTWVQILSTYQRCHCFLGGGTLWEEFHLPNYLLKYWHELIITSSDWNSFIPLPGGWNNWSILNLLRMCWSKPGTLVSEIRKCLFCACERCCRLRVSYLPSHGDQRCLTQRCNSARVKKVQTQLFFQMTYFQKKHVKKLWWSYIIVTT